LPPIILTDQDSESFDWKKNGAPYVEPVKDMLGDKHLNPEESVARLREEELSKRHRREKMPGQEKLNEVDRSKGNYIQGSVLFDRLKKLNPSLFIRIGTPGNFAIYIPKTPAEMAVDGYDPEKPLWWNGSRYVTGFPAGMVPEWGHLLNDTDGIANREVRGWRSVLIMLIKQQIIKYSDAVKEFGNPQYDQRSEFWFKQLQNFRQ
jgi:hypothetical protein